MKQFVSLHNQTHYSILDSLISVKDLFKKAKELNYPAIAITDHGSFAAAWEALNVSKSMGIKLIIGCEFYFKDDESEKLRHIILLAKNQVGYKNILTLNKLGFDNETYPSKKPFPFITWEMIEKYSEGLICLTACGNGIISQLLMRGKKDEAESALLKLKEIFGSNLGIEVQPNNMKRSGNDYQDDIDQQYLNNLLIKLAKKHDIKAVAACNAHYLNKEDHATHDVLLSINAGKSIYSPFRQKYNIPEFYLKSREEIVNFFSRNYGDYSEELCDNSLYFADLCEEPIWIDPKFSNPSGKELPIFPVKESADYTEFQNWLTDQNDFIKNLSEDKAYLRYKTYQGFNNKKSQIPAEKHDMYMARINDELETLEFQGFSSYMLIVSDYLEWSRKVGMPASPGRGCLAGSTNVLTLNGYKYLSDVTTNDFVYTHTGELKKVIDTFKFDIDESLIEFKVCQGLDTVKLTNDHKVFAAKSSKINGKIHIDSPSWIEAKHLNVGDYFYTTFNNAAANDFSTSFVLNKNENTHIEKTCKLKNAYSIREVSRNTKIPYDIVRNIKNSNISNKTNIEKDIKNYLMPMNINDWRSIPTTYKVKNNIILDDDLLYVLGRWVGDGSHRYKNKGINYSFHTNDVIGINKVYQYFTNLGCNVNKSTMNNSTNLTICLSEISNLFSCIFPSYKNTSATKHLPNFFRKLSNRQLTVLLKGLKDSDGTTRTNNIEAIKTTSKRLMLEVKEVLFKLQIASNVVIEESYTSVTKDNKIRNNSKSYCITFRGLDTVKHGPYTENGFFHKILKKSTTQEDVVYDLSVEDNHSYLTSCGVVHNSVGGCIVAYFLGIHKADSIKYDLIFERFQNKEKTSYPDIDVDVSTARRGEIIQYLINKYGSDKVCSISNINTITPKVYSRDISRSLELGGDPDTAVEVGTLLADLIPNTVHSENLNKILDECPLLSETVNKLYPAFKEHGAIVGAPRAFSTHAAGLIIADRSLVGLAPLRRDKEGAMVIEYDKDVSEANGFVKMDVLGLTTLDDMDNVVALIKERGKTFNNEHLDVDADDLKTYELISRGDTYGVFQFGTSGGTIDLCKKVKPRNIEDLAIITTLARPAAADIRESFIATRDGKKKYKVLHESLTNAFKKTYGFGLFDESILQLGKDVAGWNLNQADRIRKMIKDKGKNPEKDKKLKDEFIADTIKMGVEEGMASRIWEEEISKFSGYTFNKSLIFSQEVAVYSKDGEFLTIKPIESVIAGEYVKSRDEKSKKDIFVQVLANHDHGILPLVEVKLTNGEIAKCTINHKFRVKEFNEMLPLWKIQKENLTIITADNVTKQSINNIESISMIESYQTYDLEIDHPDHQYYLANGMLTSNSHAIVYSMVSYQTAYLKAHFPLEFLVSNLKNQVKSAKKDADKNIDKCKTEIKNLGVKILAPDLNKSDLTYTIIDDNTILTGLDAITFVSDDAINDIISKRPFKDFQDFMIRVSSSKVRANTIQALAASGCLDIFGISRKNIYLYCSDYRKKIGVWMKKNSPEDTFVYPFPEEDNWKISELYALEKKFLGESFTCKPAIAYEAFFKGGSSTSVSEIMTLNDKHKIEMFKGIVIDIFEFRVKKETSKLFGKMMAKCLLEDKNGDQISCTIFPDRWEVITETLRKKHNKTLEPGMALRFKGTVNKYEGDTALILDETYAFANPPAVPADLAHKKVVLRQKKNESNSLIEDIEDRLIEDGLLELSDEIN